MAAVTTDNIPIIATAPLRSVEVVGLCPIRRTAPNRRNLDGSTLRVLKDDDALLMLKSPTSPCGLLKTGNPGIGAHRLHQICGFPCRSLFSDSQCGIRNNEIGVYRQIFRRASNGRRSFAIRSHDHVTFPARVECARLTNELANLCLIWGHILSGRRYAES